MNKNKKDYLIFTLCFQTLILTVLFISLYFMKSTENDLYFAVKNGFLKYTNQSIVHFEEHKPDEEPPTESSEKVVAVIPEDDTTQIVESDVTDETLPEAEAPVVNVLNTGLGGMDYGITDENDVPANASIMEYDLNESFIAPVTGEITSPFGLRTHPVTGEKRFHTGIDIAAAEGEDIVAPTDGVVELVKFDDWNGNYLKINHCDSLSTVYCHCSEILVSEGDSVRAGDVVAKIGSTGTSTGPHLHFELRIDNISFDPLIALKEASDAF